MAFSIQPAPGVLAAYDTGIFFAFSDTITIAAGTWKQAVIEVRNVDTGEKFKFRKAFDTVTVSAPNQTANFTLDPSEIIRTFWCVTSKTSIFGDLDQEYKADNQDVIFDFDLRIEYEYVDATTGLVTTSGTTVDNSNQYTILNAVRQDYMVAFEANYITAAKSREFLSYRPSCITICPDENDFISWWKTSNSDHVRLITVDSGGTSNYIISMAALADGMVTLGSGPAQLNNTTPLVGVINIDSDTQYYTIQAGDWDGIVFTDATELQTFVVTQCCEEVACRFFWLNRLGGVDAYTFNGTLQIEDNPTSRFYEKPLSIPKVVPAFDYGKAKFDSRNSDVYTALSQFLTAEEAVWLQELQTSIRVCKTQPVTLATNFVTVAVQDVRNVIKNRPNGTGITRQIVWEQANETIIQSYG